MLPGASKKKGAANIRFAGVLALKVYIARLANKQTPFASLFTYLLCN